jgi:hypothetical protein
MVPVVSSYCKQLVSTPSRVSAKCYIARRRNRGTVGIGAAFQIFGVVTIVALMYNVAQRFDAATTRRSRCNLAGRPDEGLVNDSSSRRRSTLTPPDELDTNLIGLMYAIRDTDCAEIFLRHYEKFCEKALVPDGVGYRSTEWTKRTGERNEWHHDRRRRLLIELCPCVPRTRLSE